MNSITVRGYLRDVQFSHTQNGIEYEKANVICPRPGTQIEDILSVRYKKKNAKYEENDFVEITGNVRSYSKQLEGKNAVEIYIFTHFDSPEEIFANKVFIDGRICKKDSLRYSKNNKPYIHFTLANNIFPANSNKKINSYIPCSCYGNNAYFLESLNINDEVKITGQLQSHIYKKYISDSDLEYRLAHELLVDDIQKVDDTIE